MAETGKINKLKIVKELDFGLYLDGGEQGEILLPRRYVPENWKIGEELDVFIYFDSDDRIIATTETPLAMVGDFALLEVISVNNIGAFMNWGLMKDLLVPFREQKIKMETGKSYIVYVYLDEETNRIVASSRVDRFLNRLPVEYEVGQMVDLINYGQTEIGKKVIINNTHWGLIFNTDLFQKVERGQHLKGYIKNIRTDQKIDICLSKPGYEKIDEVSQSIIEIIRKHSGHIEVTDKSPVEVIYNLFGVSKKTYKKAIGALYRKKLIILDEIGIRLNDEE